jgi:hypothetical protein
MRVAPATDDERQERRVQATGLHRATRGVYTVLSRLRRKLLG